MFFAWCILCKDEEWTIPERGGFFSFSPWSFKEHFKSQNYLCNTSENENLCNACNHLKAYHGKAAMAGAALCVGWEAAPLTWFGIITDRVIDPTFSWRMLPPSLTQPLFCTDDLSWVFFLCKESDGAGKWPRHQLLLHGHLKPLVPCLGNCNSPSDIFPSCFFSRTVLNGFLKHTGFLHLRKISI